MKDAKYRNGGHLVICGETLLSGLGIRLGVEAVEEEARNISSLVTLLAKKFWTHFSSSPPRNVVKNWHF